MKRGTSIISLVLCGVAMALITTALVIANNNSAMYEVNKIARVEENSAYVKVYTLEEINQIAKEAYVDNYLSFYEKQIKIEEFKERIIKTMLEKVPQDQLNNVDVFVYADGIIVEYKK